jgi:hypothetical protein
MEIAMNPAQTVGAVFEAPAPGYAMLDFFEHFSGDEGVIGI